MSHPTFAHHFLLLPLSLPTCVQRPADLTVHKCMFTSDSVVLATFLGENALDNVSAITRYFPGAYSSAKSYFCMRNSNRCNLGVTHRAVSSISPSMAYGQLQRGLCAHRYVNEIFRMQRQHSVAPFQYVCNYVPLSSSISLHTPLASILSIRLGVRRHRFRLWTHHLTLSAP